jgi:hypothetical protein
MSAVWLGGTVAVLADAVPQPLHLSDEVVTGEMVQVIIHGLLPGRNQAA